jgi:hypothetical protein
MSITATVSSQPISASVSGDRISASVPAAAPVAANVAGGVGPIGPAGPVGPAGSNALASLDDTVVANPSDGDLLRYASGKWRNHPETELTLDGMNF